MRTYGRSGASIAWLRAFSQPIPNVWLLQEQAEADEANNQVSLTLEQQLQAEGDLEAEDMSFAECARSPPPAYTCSPHRPPRCSPQRAHVDGAL